MPTPNKGESKQDFVGRCVPIVMKEKGTEDRKQAVAKCYGMWEQSKGERDYTLGERERLVCEVWEAAYGGESGELAWSWPSQVFDDYLIVTVEGRYVKVPYSMSDSEVSFSDPNNWAVVEHEWRSAVLRPAEVVPVPIRTLDLPDGRKLYKCYGALYGDPDHKDAYGTYFDQRTNYHLDWYDKRPWLYHHGNHPAMGLTRIGYWLEHGEDEQGLFFLGELEQSFKFRDAITELLEEEVLYPSQGTLSYTARVESDGHVADWPMSEISSTVSPANFRQKPISERAARAYRALGGELMEEHKGGLFDLLFGRRSKEEPAGEAVPPSETPPEPKETVEAPPPTQSTPEQEPPQQLSWEEAARQLQIPTIVEAIQAVDKRIAELAVRVQQIEGTVQGMAKTEVERVQRALTSDTWFQNLYSVTRDGTATTPEEAQRMTTTTLPLKEGKSIAGHILEVQQRK